MGKFLEGLYDDLSLYVRQQAWLNAVPEKLPHDKSKEPGKSRIQAMQEAGERPEVPSVDGGEYLIGYLFEVGPTMAGGMGEAPLSHGELRAWQDNTGIELHAWEARMLRALSLDYLAQAQKSEKRDCKPPYGPVWRRAMVAKKIDEVFG